MELRQIGGIGAPLTQYELSLEDIETAMAVVHAEDEAVDAPASRPAKPRNTNRGSLPKHLPRIEEVIAPGNMTCGCGGERHVIGEDMQDTIACSNVSMIGLRWPTVGPTHAANCTRLHNLALPPSPKMG